MSRLPLRAQPSFARRSLSATTRLESAARCIAFAGAAVLGLAAFASCDAKSNASPTVSEKCPPSGDKNTDVMNGLAPDCASCHGSGANKPFFASLTAFETMLAYDTKYVVRGKPEESELVLLLKGEGQGTFTQMPTNGASFAARESSGSTQITVAQIEDWIRKLPPQSAPNLDYLKAATVRRLTADEILNSLNEPLGLTDRDFFEEQPALASTDPLTLKEGDVALPARSPDALNHRGDDAFVSAQVYPRYLGLGGASWLIGKPPDASLSPTFLETMTQLSQARCRKAVSKGRNAAFFKFAKPSDTSATAKEAIKKNIGYLHLRLLGEQATAEAVDDLYDNLFVPYEATDVSTAWIAVCAGLVRHPLWVSY